MPFLLSAPGSADLAALETRGFYISQKRQSLSGRLTFTLDCQQIADLL